MNHAYTVQKQRPWMCFFYQWLCSKLRTTASTRAFFVSEMRLNLWKYIVIKSVLFNLILLHAWVKHLALWFWWKRFLHGRKMGVFILKHLWITSVIIIPPKQHLHKKKKAFKDCPFVFFFMTDFETFIYVWER